MSNIKQRDLLHSLVEDSKHFGLDENQLSESELSQVAACEDLFNIYVKVKGDKVVEARFNGEGCAISHGSIEAVLRNIVGKNISEVNELLNKYELFINDKLESTDTEELDVFEIVKTHVSRKKCALAPIDTIRKVIN